VFKSNGVSVAVITPAKDVKQPVYPLPESITTFTNGIFPNCLMFILAWLQYETLNIINPSFSLLLVKDDHLIIILVLPVLKQGTVSKLKSVNDPPVFITGYIYEAGHIDIGDVFVINVFHRLLETSNIQPGM
jgi:hypothetical protein